ncbi:MAG: NAD(P)/FAD-dependent oxidoreductase [Pseudomonadota bacterium]
MSSVDSIIVGAGHNGLVCAAYLAQKGQRVIVLEAADEVGGLAGGREFHPGFRASIAHSISHFSTKIAAELKLASHGYTVTGESTPLIGLAAGRDPVIINGRDITGVGNDDRTAYAAYVDELEHYAKALAPAWTEIIPRIGSQRFSEVMTFAKIGLRLRRLGKQAMAEFLRVASLPARDLVDERFDDDLLKALLCWDGLIGSRMAPRSPNSAVLAMLYRMSEGNAGQHQIAAGGTSALVNALRAAAEAAGAEIRTGCSVENITIAGDTDGLSATGVRLRDGESLAADNVISAVDSKRTFLNLVGVQYLDIEFSNRIRRIRTDGLVGKLHLALDSLPEFRGVDAPNGRFIIADTMDAIEFAFDDSKYGRPSTDPVIECVIPSLNDPQAAPDGKHVLSAHVMYVPYRHKDGWSESTRTEIQNAAINAIERVAPKLRDSIVHAEFLTPADIESQYGATGGHWHHGEFAMDQMLMMRPTYGAAQYSTPIPGLFLASAGSHPGGDLVGAAGHNAAQAVLR